MITRIFISVLLCFLILCSHDNSNDKIKFNCDKLNTLNKGMKFNEVIPIIGLPVLTTSGTARTELISFISKENNMVVLYFDKSDTAKYLIGGYIINSKNDFLCRFGDSLLCTPIRRFSK
jgi:hypothetical protein